MLSCFTIVGGCSIPAAAEGSEDHLAKMEIMMERASGKFDFPIPANTIMEASSSFPLEYGEKVTITASYSPTSASLDFGLIDSQNNYHWLSASKGSFQATITIDQRGNYTFAVRNNSDYEVSVTGFVNY